MPSDHHLDPRSSRSRAATMSPAASPRASTTRCGCWRASGRWASSRARTAARRSSRAGAAEWRRCRAATWARSRRTPACRPRRSTPRACRSRPWSSVSRCRRQPPPRPAPTACAAPSTPASTSCACWRCSRSSADYRDAFIAAYAVPALDAGAARRGSTPTRWRSPTSSPGAPSTGVACAPRSTRAAVARARPRAADPPRPIGPRSQNACQAWTAWCDTLFSEPAPAQDAWQRDRMEYAFSVAARVSDDAVRRAHADRGRVLRGARSTGTPSTSTARSRSGPPPTAPGASVVRTVMPGAGQLPRHAGAALLGVRGRAHRLRSAAGRARPTCRTCC